MKQFDRIYYSSYEVTTYLIDGGKEYAMIDTGWVRRVDDHLSNLRNDGLDLNKIRKVIISHPHADHAAGITVIKEKLGCAVYAHTLAVPVLERGDEIAMAGSLPFCDFYEPCPPCKIDVALKDKDIVRVGDITLEVIHTPGHTPGSIALKFNDYLFTGDTVFSAGSLGWIDAHWGSNPEDYIYSLELIKSLKPAYILPSHGLPFKFKKSILNKAIKRVEPYLDHSNGMGSPRPRRSILKNTDKHKIS